MVLSFFFLLLVLLAKKTPRQSWRQWHFIRTFSSFMAMTTYRGVTVVVHPEGTRIALLWHVEKLRSRTPKQKALRSEMREWRSKKASETGRRWWLLYWKFELLLYLSSAFSNQVWKLLHKVVKEEWHKQNFFNLQVQRFCANIRTLKKLQSNVLNFTRFVHYCIFLVEAVLLTPYSFFKILMSKKFPMISQAKTRLDQNYWK